MSQRYFNLPAVSLLPQSTFSPRIRSAPVVRLESPATMVVTDFSTVTPITITPQAPIDMALRKMKTAGVRLLFVVNDIEEIIGLITITDIMGERPIKVTQQTRLPRTTLTVASIMTPQSDIQVFDAARIESAVVGDIVETLRTLGRQHALLARIDRDRGAHQVIGMFSTSQISKLLGEDVTQIVSPAASLSEIVEKIG